MRKSWKPSKTQRREFAQRMQNDSEFAESYNNRKREKEEKRRASSKFDYRTAGGSYIPTKVQHDFCLEMVGEDLTSEQENACNIVASGYACNEKVDHDFIHIVNELIRNRKTI